MAAPVGGNQAFAATVTYSVAPNASYARGEVRYLDDGLSDWDNTSADALVGNAYDMLDTAAYTGWSQSTNDTVVITIDLATARSAPVLSAQGFAISANISRPTGALLESSDDNSSWTTVENLSGLTGATPSPSRSWLIEWNTSGAGAHRYWRVTLTHGAQWILLARILFGNNHISLGKPVTSSPAPWASFPARGYDRIRSGEADWTDSVFNQLSSSTRAHNFEGFELPMFMAWLQSAGATFTLTLDQGAANAANRLMLKGYHGSDSVFRPTAILIEYSDDNSSWTTHENKTGLTGGGTPGASYWIVVSDVTGEVHRYWRATVTHGGAATLVSSFELLSDWVNLALARPYTLSTAANAAFLDNRPTQRLGPGESDWQTGAGKLTNGERAWPGAVATGVGWALNNAVSASARIDLGSAQSGDHFVVHGIHGAGGGMRTPSAVVIAYSDDDSSWTDVFTKTSLTVVNAAKGRWAVRADISGESAHRYWRATVTSGQNGTFVTLTQLEFWQEQAGGPIAIPVDTATEVETANPITPVISRQVLVGQAAEAETANPISPEISRRVEVGQAVETELARPITPVIGRVVMVGQATESETANPVAPVIRREVLIGQAREVELARFISPVKPIFVPVQTAVERELARMITAQAGEPFLPNLTCEVIGLPVTCEVSGLEVQSAILSLEVDCEVT